MGECALGGGCGCFEGFGGGGRWGEAFETVEDQGRVEVDVAPDCEQGDAAVADAEAGEVWTGEDVGLDLITS